MSQSVSFNPFSLIKQDTSSSITLFLCGDVMTGRGIDQILSYPSSPIIYEQYMKDARGYVQIAVEAYGPIPYKVDDSYIWGYSLEEFKRIKPDVKIINLETSITKSNDYWKGKGINYRMHPENIGCLTVAEIDFCSLANNHVLDWGYSGLSETLSTLNKAYIKFAGAGQNLTEAEKPAIFEIKEKGRVIIFSYGLPSSGVPSSWAATDKKAGVNYLSNLSHQTVLKIKSQVKKIKKTGDLIICSIHWGGNWGYHIPSERIEFAHRLIDEAGVDIIHGHSSHHVIGLEIYKEKPIIYGCGDFINDYEGISGNDSYRDNLPLMYFIKMNPSTGKLIEMKMTPVLIRNFRINKATESDAIWLMNLLNREGKQFKNRVKITENNRLILDWNTLLE